jgi:hypothetical protein
MMFVFGNCSFLGLVVKSSFLNLDVNGFEASGSYQKTMHFLWSVYKRRALFIISNLQMSQTKNVGLTFVRFIDASRAKMSRYC